jgi:hypothetical protein
MIGMERLGPIRRLHRDEQGYALVIAVLLIAIMMVLMVVSLEAGQSALRRSQEGVRWTKTLAIAEAGVNAAITTLGQDRRASSSCPVGAQTVCRVDAGEYQVSWRGQADGSIVVTSRGYYPSLTAARYTREVRVVLEPVPVFRYALFSQDALTVKNNGVIVGDVYSALSVTLDQNQQVCGSVIAAGGGITIGANSRIRKAESTSGCSGKSGAVWANGSITLGNGVIVEGDATASAPSGTTCSPTSTSYQISGGTVQGNATACGRIAATVGGTAQPGVNTTPPAVESLPTFVFDINNYPDLTCYPSSGTCGPSNTSSTAVSSFNAYVAGHRSSMRGTFAVWQTSPTQSTKVDLESIKLSGDLTVITNAPVDFGNTTTITTAPGVSAATLIVISLYVPPVGTTCDTNGGECSIYSKNSVVFDDGVDSDPTDGVAGLLYTPGKMAVKNQGSAAEGALYAGSIDIKNGFTIKYNGRIDRVLGFGKAMEPTLWQEIDA